MKKKIVPHIIFLKYFTVINFMVVLTARVTISAANSRSPHAMFSLDLFLFFFAVEQKFLFGVTVKNTTVRSSGIF